MDKEMYLPILINVDTILDYVNNLEPNELLSLMKEIDIHIQTYAYSLKYFEWLLNELLNDGSDDLDEILKRTLGSKFNKDEE